jgi:hypothetical protein
MTRLLEPFREHPAERGEEGTIDCSNRRPRLLSTKHQELMAQNEQFDILGELAAAAAHEQPQQRREREIGEREEHPPMLPDLAPADIENRNLVLEPRRPMIMPTPTPTARTEFPAASGSRALGHRRGDPMRPAKERFAA